MKANVRVNNKNRAPFNGRKYRLTVGLVVKNEEKRIRRCLDAMKPLLDAVSSELVITDTGSTDNTIEILKEYTDKIYSFPWNGNISDARNVCIKAAQGEWYLSMDADEWFENVDDIIDFFNSGDCDNYGCATYEIRNYFDFEGKRYMQQQAARMAKMNEDIHYEGRIHDAIIGRVNPCKQLKSFAHHYGYVYVNEEQHKAKFERNLAGLAKDIEEYPTDLRFVYQIIKEYASVKENEKALDWCYKGLQIEKEHPDRTRRLEISTLLVKLYYSNDKYQKAIDFANEVIESEKQIEVYHMDIHWMKMLSLIMLQREEEAITAGLAYLKIYHQFESGKLNNDMLLFGGTDSAASWVCAEVYMYVSRCYLKLEKYEEAQKYLDKCNINELDTIKHQTVQISLNIAEKTERYESILQLYERIQQTKDENKQMNFIEVLENNLGQYREKRADIIEQFSKMDGEEPYIMLNKLRTATVDIHGKNEVHRIVDWFIRHFQDWNPYFADLLYYAMKYDIDILPFTELLDVEDLQLYTSAIIKNHLDFAGVTIYYFLKHSVQTTMKGKYWSICLREHVVISSEGMNFEQYVSYFKSYAQDLADYAHSLYLPELFTEDKILILPRVYRFGHYMGQTFKALEQGNSLEYIKNLKTALKHYPIMKEPIQVLMKTFEKAENAQQEQQKKQNEEFFALAAQAKQQIEKLLSWGNLEEAKELTTQLADMLPGDPDVKRYLLEEEGKVPTLNQLMQDLPQ